MRKIKNSKSILLLFFLTAVNFSYADGGAYFCGGYYSADEYYFNLFNQENISQKAFYPFLRVDEEAFYDGVENYESENIRLWYHYFGKKYSKESLAQIILEDSKNGFSEDFKKDTQFLNYLNFAKNCELIAIQKRVTWDYNEILNSKEANVSELLINGFILFEKENDKRLKLRYAYQLVRLYHYGKMYEEAIMFFEKNIKSSYEKNEIYYYLLDQLGGCYYKLEQYEKAAYTFLTVFEKSLDKKASAFTSYKFCAYKGAEGKRFLKTQEERANQIFITGLRQFSDELSDIERIRELGAAEDKQELLMMRIVNNIERISLRQYSEEERSIMAFDRETIGKIEEALYFIDTVIDSNPKNKDFWQLTSSYLSFLSGAIDEAKLKLTKITSNKLKHQKEHLKVIYNVFSWDKVSTENEKWLANFFSQTTHKNNVNYYNCIGDDTYKYNCNSKDFVFKQLSHYYFKEDELAKAFLLHNSLINIEGVSSHKLVDQLIDFVKKPNKNPFEKLLIQSAIEEDEDTSYILKRLHNEKGKIYLRSGDFKSALSFLNKNAEEDISARIFSNNVKECFSCEAFKVMDDKVYQSEFFSFLNDEMNSYTLAVNLKKLDSITRNDEEKPWKRKLANYLLANYFFNVSNTGYYRTVNYPGNNYWYNYDFGVPASAMDNLVTQKSDFYFSIIYNTYNDLASISKQYYKKTIELSSDEELNARCSYMIAKCELNYFYNNTLERDHYDYEGGEQDTPTREGFSALKNRYNNTKFYEEIKSRCGFFKHYDAQ